MTVGSLFAGIGGFDLAASRVWGWDCVRWQVEIDPWARRVLTKHWPNVPKHGDIRELTGDELEPVDLVCGGFPCQPFSVAGQRLGQEDERALWPEMLRLVQVIQPRWVVGENVPGLIDLGLDAVSAGLEAAGYEVWTLGIPAVAVGAPHRRQRLWIVGYSERARAWHQPGKAGGQERQSAGPLEPAPIRPGDGAHGAGWLAAASMAGRAALADAQRIGRLGRQGHPQRCLPDGAVAGRAKGADGPIAVCEAGPQEPGGSEWWTVEPSVGRVAHGIPGRVDRLRGLGNAIVPAVAERLFRWIDEAEGQQ